MSTATLSVSAEALAFQRGVDHWFLDWGNGTAYQQLTSAAAKSAPGTSPSAPAAASTPVSTSAPVAASEPVTASAPAASGTSTSSGTPASGSTDSPAATPPAATSAPSPAPVAAPAPVADAPAETVRAALLGYSDSSPVSDPGGASGMNDFTPVLESGTAEAGAPVIATASLTGGAGQSITLTGSGLDDTGTEYVVYGQTSASDGTYLDATVEVSAADGVTIMLPAGLPANAMYLVWAVNGTGSSAPVAVNQTQAWWIGAPGESLGATTATPTVDSYSGATMSVYGTNLSNGAAMPESWVYLQPTDGSAGIWAPVTAVNPYEVSFTLPTVSATTTYNVWVNNGLGGNEGWSEVKSGSSPQVLSMAPAASSWSTAAGNVFNVVNYGADPTGSADSGAAIDAAINALNAAQAAAPSENFTLYFPDGTYLVSGGEQLKLRENVRLLGQSESGTILKFQGAIAYVPGQGALQALGLSGENEIDSITIEHAGATVSTGIPTGWNGANDLIRSINNGNIVLNGVTVTSNEGAVILQGDSGVTVENSTVYGGIDLLWRTMRSSTTIIFTKTTTWKRNWCWAGRTT